MTKRFSIPEAAPYVSFKIALNVFIAQKLGSRTRFKSMRALHALLNMSGIFRSK